ncbi:MAG TPA: hypothetical protein VLE23_14830, partial [Geminicoccaceae bacterium]|nr:hypothetical protein [Geminicoccaceae bacterium]
PGLVLWLSPVLAGFAAAIPLAALTSRPDLGDAARRRGWFLTPEELAPPPELAGLPGAAHAPMRRGEPWSRWPALPASAPGRPAGR